jgi:hypothetical protein
MATTDRTAAEAADAASDVATALADAELAHLVVARDGDCLAAAGIVAAACRAAGIPYHVSTARTTDAVRDRLAGGDEAATPVLIGASVGDATALDPAGAVSPHADSAARALGSDPDPIHALAGVVAAGAVPSQTTPELFEAAGLERQPGLGVPTNDLADGLAHSGLFHAAFSGDPDAAADALAEVGLPGARAAALDAEAARRAGSFLALVAGSAAAASPIAARAIERALRPHRTDDPFRTLGGYADVLAALAEEAPGLGVALIVGSDGREAALEAWRDHGRTVHAAVRDADTARYSGLLVARTDGPPAPVARLQRDYRSPEPAVLAIGDGEAAAAATDAPVEKALAAGAEAAGGSMLARGVRGTATFDPDRTEPFIEAFREAL